MLCVSRLGSSFLCGLCFLYYIYRKKHSKQNEDPHVFRLFFVSLIFHYNCSILNFFLILLYPQFAFFYIYCSLQTFSYRYFFFLLLTQPLILLRSFRYFFLANLPLTLITADIIFTVIYKCSLCNLTNVHEHDANLYVCQMQRCRVVTFFHPYISIGLYGQNIHCACMRTGRAKSV